MNESFFACPLGDLSPGIEWGVIARALLGHELVKTIFR
jgi:hypothetical protein